jgi:hypothetical protein
VFFVAFLFHDHSQDGQFLCAFTAGTCGFFTRLATSIAASFKITFAHS